MRFLGWRDDRAALLAAADVCVMPSRYEPFGTVMAEAWSAGTPLIVAAAQGPRAYVKDGENGLMVPIDDAAALAAAIAPGASPSPICARGSWQAGTTPTTRSSPKQAYVRGTLSFYRAVAGSGRVAPDER